MITTEQVLALPADTVTKIGHWKRAFTKRAELERMLGATLTLHVFRPRKGDTAIEWVVRNWRIDLKRGVAPTWGLAIAQCETAAREELHRSLRALGEP
jgi:hypothetical protein